MKYQSRYADENWKQVKIRRPDYEKLLAMRSTTGNSIPELISKAIPYLMNQVGWALPKDDDKDVPVS